MTPRKQTRNFTGKITTPETPWLASDESNPKSVTESTLSLEQIKLPSNQPRRYFDATALSDLAASIKQHGILQPLLVRPNDEGSYELVAGERRYRAAIQVGLKEVPVTIKNLTSDEAWQLALIENLQREDLNPIEETEGILQLLAIKLEIPVSDVSRLLHRLQKEQVGSLDLEDKKVSNNVIGKTVDEPHDIDTQVTPEPPFDKTTDNNEEEIREEKTQEQDIVVNSGFENKINQSDVDNNELYGESQTDNNVIGKPETLSTDATIKSQRSIIEAVFNGLGLMTWESFITNRLPLLNLPSDVIEALREGKIAYTKAREIAKVKDSTKRNQILEEAITLQLSLTQIKERINALKIEPDKKVETELTERLKGAMVQIKKQKILEDPKKRKELEKLLFKIEALIGGEPSS